MSSRCSAALIAFAVVGCGVNGGSGARPPLVTAVVEPSSAAIGPTEWVTFRARAANSADARFQWSIRPEGPIIDQDGRVFAHLAPGKYVVIATTTTDPVLSASADLVVYDDLMDLGGRVMADSQIYTLWWGDPADFPADAKTSVERALAGLDGSSYLGLTREYMRGAAPAAKLVGSFMDASTSPPREANEIMWSVAAEVCSVLARENIVPDRNAIYVVYGGTFPVNSPWTAFHIVGSCSRIATPFALSFPIAYVPVPDVTHASAFPMGVCNRLSLATVWMIHATAHEVLESITDPFVGIEPAWQTANALEVADNCSGLAKSACVSLGKHTYLLPGLYSNARHACAD
jgi:hypothetical protein